ncbi:hypothetical protein EU534_00965 [Candidatus Heimdallarchaeota archaeon]|nr:MAG: hypothetical protein EU534_00965 [Candidatus Heimdallarchaeota archaeon]
MPHRIYFVTEAEFADPLQHYSNQEFVLEFEDAAQVLKLWRNPHLGRSSREGAVLSIASKNAVAVENILQKIMNTPLTAPEEERLINEMKLLRFIGDRVLPDVLERVNRNELQTVEDILKYIQDLLKEIKYEGTVDLQSLAERLNQLKDIVDIEITDAFGRKKRISRESVMDLLGKILGRYLVKQISVAPIDEVQKRPRGTIRLKETYKSAILSSQSIPPTEVKQEDIVRVKKDRRSLVYFIVDMSQSMRKTVFEGGMSRLDGALLTSLSLYYYFKTLNRRKRKRYNMFKLAVVPIMKNPKVIDNDKDMEQFLLTAEARGKTYMVQSVLAAIEHAKKQQKDRDIDVQFTIVTDGMPNVPSYPFTHRKSSELKKYFDDIDTKIKPDTIECMLQLNGIFSSLKNDKSRNWKISYFLMGPESLRSKEIYIHTKRMLKGITRPILVDPAQVKRLGEQILKESIIHA